MEELIKELTKIYPDVKFQEGNESGNRILLYDNRNLMWDDKFNNIVVELAEKYLKESEFDAFAYIYDGFSEKLQLPSKII